MADAVWLCQFDDSLAAGRSHPAALRVIIPLPVSLYSPGNQAMSICSPKGAEPKL
jgi:hypothetical protein